MLTASRSIRAGSWVYGVRSGLSVNDANIGRAAASYWLKGEQAQDQFHRADHAHRAVLRAVEVLPLGVRADHQADGAVGIDVVGAVLGVVLDHEDRRLGPVLAVADGLDEPAQRQVVAGHAGLRRERAGARARGVVFAQAHDDEAGQGAVLLEVLELLEETSRRCRCRGRGGRRFLEMP